MFRSIGEALDPEDVKEKLSAIKDEVHKVIVGYDDALNTMLVAMLSGGHALIEGPPGIGKTTLAKTFAQAIGGGFKRIQMTPDLLPADILGVNVYNQRTGDWELRRGPIFTNVLLVDELNRASPKVQSAFLEVMQELQVTIEGVSLPVPKPFMVLATQVPFSGVGTHLLTDVQKDRFGYRLDLGYPGLEVELSVLERIDEIEAQRVEAVTAPQDLVEMGRAALGVYVHERVQRYIVDLVLWLRGQSSVQMGPSTRASIWLKKGARALALIDGRDHVIPDDVKRLAPSVLTHRVELTSMARAEGETVEELVARALDTVPVPKT